MAATYISISDGLLQPEPPVVTVSDARANDELALSLLERIFAVPFAAVDVQSGCWQHRPDDQPRLELDGLIEFCRGVAEMGRAEIIAYEDPLAVLAVSLSSSGGTAPVALALFVVRQAVRQEDMTRSAQALGLDPEWTADWARRQAPWTAESLLAAAQLVTDHLATLERLDQVERESRSLSVNLAATYEEISLLYRLTQNLKISESDEELGRAALEWMEEVIPAEGLAIQFLPIAEQDEALSYPARSRSELLSFGRCPVDNQTFARLIDHFQSADTTRPIVVNQRTTALADWPFPEVRQMIAVPLVEGENLFGWLAAFNHAEGAEFGTIEASLLSSVGAILGIHSGNIDLYRQQAELLAGVVRALSSAIDAKDPYTCGHSDRVARVSVRLAEELGCDAETCKTIYLSGLLHDVGKIGIDDSVLRKPGALTDAEYEHIKTHVTIGHKILAGLKKLDNILPVVLHHHEAWDGSGYPGRLPAEEIPLVARIVAVADAFDAMGSDRPYRKGMPDEKIDAIFRSGADKQWDPAVVDAFFRCRDDIRGIMHDDRQPQVVLPQ